MADEVIGNIKIMNEELTIHSTPFICIRRE
jgi:hypothetical protein